MELKRTNLNDKITDTINDFNDNWTTIENEVSEKVQNFKIKNEIENGDFSDGTTGWSAQKLTLTTSNNHAWLFGEFGSLAYPNIQQSVDNKAGDKYFVRFEISENMNEKVRSHFQMGTQTALYFSGNGIKFDVFTSNNNTRVAFLNHVVQVDGIVNYKVTNFMLINLTETFGEGNEPTKPEMDELTKIIPNQWWDDELTLTQKQALTWQLNLIRKNTNVIISLGGTI